MKKNLALNALRLSSHITDQIFYARYMFDIKISNQNFLVY